MKVKRYKKANKRLNFYINNFKYRAPIQVLIDGTFAFHCIKNKLLLEEQLKSYLQIELRFLTTPCIIIEAESLCNPTVAQKLKSFCLNKCGHEKSPISGADCIKSLVSEQNHYVVATQDRNLQLWARHMVGVALLYFHNVVPHLDEPSKNSRKYVNSKNKSEVSSFEDERLNVMKNKVGLIQQPVDLKRAKKKKPKGPNPLSCKKKKSVGNLRQTMK